MSIQPIDPFLHVPIYTFAPNERIEDLVMHLDENTSPKQFDQMCSDISAEDLEECYRQSFGKAIVLANNSLIEHVMKKFKEVSGKDLLNLDLSAPWVKIFAGKNYPLGTSLELATNYLNCYDLAKKFLGLGANINATCFRISSPSKSSSIFHSLCVRIIESNQERVSGNEGESMYDLLDCNEIQILELFISKKPKVFEDERFCSTHSREFVERVLVFFEDQLKSNSSLVKQLDLVFRFNAVLPDTLTPIILEYACGEVAYDILKSASIK